MKTKQKTPGLTGAIKEKKLTPKQKEFAEIARKARELGGKLFKEGKISPL